MHARRFWVVSLVAVAVAVVAFALRGLVLNLDGDERPDDGQEQSTDLTADLRLMWRTRGRTSTPRAINAASRVFNTVNLVGLTRQEVISRISDPETSSDRIYNFPFYPADPAAMVYRFDTGSYGWQFNIYFDDDGRVRRVQRLGIE
jgi:hypothetical protein